MKTFNQKQFIKKLLSVSPRQFEGETKAAKSIEDALSQIGITDYKTREYYNYVPLVIKAELKADGQKIACQANCFKSGVIKDKNNIISSLYNFYSEDFNLEVPNINFNPYCPTISCGAFYSVPSLAVTPDSMFKIARADKVCGEVKIKKVKHKSQNILVGNLTNPQAIYFTHYDSINAGAVDNASGVAVLMDVLYTKPELINHNLFVFAGAEELSYDWPIYWGFGYRQFEKQYLKLLDQAKDVFVVDGLGHDKPLITNDSDIIHQAFPLKDIGQFVNKTQVIYSNIDKLMRFYHSDSDDINKINFKYLKQATKMITDNFIRS